MIARVRARNFLSWEELSLDLKTGVTLIDGWNEDDQTPEGSGKSSILNAICWGYFGKIPKDANIDDVIKEGQKNCGVEIEHDDGVVVRRLRGPNELAIVKNGQVIKGKDAKETQILVEEYLGLTFETFCQTIYFAQNYTKKFITSNQEEKGKILSEVQDLIIFDKAAKEVKSLIKAEEETTQKLKHQKDLALKDEELTKRDISAEELKHQHALQQQIQRIKNLESQLLNAEMQHKNALDQQTLRVNNINNQIIEAEKTAQGHEISKAHLLESVLTLVYDEGRERLLVEANNQIIAQAAVVTSEIKNIDRLVVQRTTAESQGKRLATRYKQIQVDKQKNLDFIANPSKNCPTCNTKLEVCDTTHATMEVARLEAEEVEIISSLTALDAELSVPVPTKDELNKKLNEFRQARIANDVAIQEIHSIKDQMNRAAAHLTSFDQNIKSQRDRADKLRTQVQIESQPLIFDKSPLNALKVLLEAEKLPIQFDEGPIEALKAKLDSLKSNLQDLDHLANDKRTHLVRLENLKNGFKEIKSYVFNSMLNEVNARVHKYLTYLFEVPISIRFTNNDMKIETQVKYDGVDRSLGLLSGGQFRRVSLAVDLALSDVITARKGSRVGVLILDEYFKDLSENSMEKCLTLLEGRGQPVLLIEHNSLFKNIVNNSIMVRLENGTSRVEV